MRPQQGRAGEVIAPPYDVVDTEQARAMAAGRPWSFLHVSRAEIDLAPGTDPHTPAVYARAARNWQAMIDAEVIGRDELPAFYAYRLAGQDHALTGLAAVVSVAAYAQGRVRRHELTRADKEDDRVRHIDALNAQTGPVMLAHHPDAALSALVAAETERRPDIEAGTADGVRHSLWAVDDPARVKEMQQACNALDTLYIADGHHRSAAAARVAAMRRQAGGQAGDYFLAVMFDAEQMRILDYNRLVHDLHGMEADEFLQRLSATHAVTAVGGEPVSPPPGEVGMYLGGNWHRVELHPSHGDIVEQLDVSRLSDQVLGPHLGIGDLRVDDRIGFMGGIHGLRALQESVDAGRAAVAFSLHPTTMPELLAVADAGRIMPPKSTWFEPKLADGLLSHVLDD